MALFTIIRDSGDNKPPYQTGTLTLTLSDSEVHVFTVDDFTINTQPVYADPENDNLLKIKILAIGSNNGVLKLNGNIVAEEDEILISDIAQGYLTYEAVFVEGTSLLTSPTNRDYFDFDVADDGSNSYGGLTGTVNIITDAGENLPPTIGDGEQTIDYNQTLIFTRDMLTTALTPPYDDPEGDAALLLHIVTLPTIGSLHLFSEGTLTQSTPVSANQIITFSDIDSGLFRYVPDSGTIDFTNVDFKFGIADEGSKIFSY